MTERNALRGVSLVIGRDGRCRVAVVQVKSGLLRRPIYKLYKLEICAETDNLPPITSSPESSNVDDDDECKPYGRVDARRGRCS